MVSDAGKMRRDIVLTQGLTKSKLNRNIVEIDWTIGWENSYVCDITCNAAIQLYSK